MKTSEQLRREAEYERDRYEALRDQVEREREQEYERERQERQERIQASRASNRLYHGEIDDFGEAMRAFRDQVREEVDLFDLGDADALDISILSSMEAYATAASEAENIWRDEYRSFMNALKVTVIHRLRNRMAETGDELYGQFADALDAEDYTGLAI